MSEAEISNPEPVPSKTLAVVHPSQNEIEISSRLKRLREPFDPAQIGKLPRTTCRDCSKSAAKNCSQHKKQQCRLCGNYMTTAHIDLDYVGHAAVTDRLLEVDPGWTWEPMSVDAQTGAPLLINNGSTLWIKLTVLGVTRIGVGTVEGGKFEVEKQLIGDAIRNAAMRFGVALDLWSKEDLSRPEESTHEAQQSDQSPSTVPINGEDTATESGLPIAAAETLAKVREAIGGLFQGERLELKEWWKPENVRVATVDRLSEDDAKIVLKKVAEIKKSRTDADGQTADARVSEQMGDSEIQDAEIVPDSPTPPTIDPEIHAVLDDLNFVLNDRKVIVDAREKLVAKILEQSPKPLKELTVQEAEKVVVAINGVDDATLTRLLMDSK